MGNYFFSHDNIIRIGVLDEFCTGQFIVQISEILLVNLHAMMQVFNTQTKSTNGPTS